MTNSEHRNCRKNCAHGTRADRFEKRCRVREPPRHLAPPPVNHHSWCLSKQRASAKGPSTITDIFLESPLPQTMSLIISCRPIIFALIITIDISCTGSRRRIARVFAMTLPRTGVVELTNAPYPKHKLRHVPFTCRSALTNIYVTPAGQPAIGY